MTFTRSTIYLLFGRDSVGLVDTASMVNIYDRDRPRLIVDPVNDPVTAPAGAVSIVQRRQQTSAHTVGVVQQRSVDELERRKRHRLGEPLSQRPPDRGSHAQRETLRRVVAHAECPRRAAIDSANSSAPTTSPRANSASESTKCRTVSGSDSTDKVSSNASRSSTAINTADGRPCTVTVTRSW